MIVNWSRSQKQKISMREFPMSLWASKPKHRVEKSKVAFMRNHSLARTIRWSVWLSRRYTPFTNRLSKIRQINRGKGRPPKRKNWWDRRCSRIPTTVGRTRGRRSRQRIWLSRWTVRRSQAVSSSLFSWCWAEECACSCRRSFGRVYR